MKSTFLAAGLAAALISFPLVVQAGPIERECMASGFRSASSRLCSCLEKVAKSELKRSDRRKAARFFQDPHKAQEMRQSDRPRDEAFWKRYKVYADRAAKICG